MTRELSKWLHRTVSVAVVGALVLGPDSVAASGASMTPSRSDGTRTTLNIIAAEPTSGLDPNTAIDPADFRVMELMYDTLLDFNARGQLVPDLAKTWTLSQNGLTYTFNLQHNAKFSNGAPITAEDVRFSLLRMKHGPAMGAQLADMTAVSIVNSGTVRIHLAQRSRVFLNALATVGNAAILDQQAVQGNASYFTLPKDTSGPWQLVQYTHEDNLTMTANKYYWNTGYPKIKTINYTFSEDPTSAAAALQSGTEDMYYPIDPQDAIRLAKAGVTNTYVSDQPGVVEWGLDKSKPPFNNLDVRLAVAYMAPRADKFKVCWDNIGANSDGNIIFPGNWAYTAGIDMFDISQKAALAKASKLMDEAGWKMGSNGVRVADNVPGVRNGTAFKVTVPYENDWTQAACNTLLLQTDEAPLGVAITPQAYDAATFYTKVAQNAFEMFHAGDGWSSVDQELEQGFTCNGQADNIIAKWCNKQVDELVNKAGETSNLATAAELYHQVQLIVEQQEPLIVTGVQYGITSATTKLHGFYARPDNSNRALIYSTLSS